MNKKILFLLVVLVGPLASWAWAAVPNTLFFFGDKYIQTGAPERNFSGTFYIFTPATKIGKTITVFAYKTTAPKSIAQVNADEDLMACEKQRKNNPQITCGQIKCAENDYLFSEMVRVYEIPTKIQLSRYTPDGSIKFVDRMIGTSPNGTVEEYQAAFCKLQVF